MTVPQMQDLTRVLRKDGHTDLAEMLETLPPELYVDDLTKVLRQAPVKEMRLDPFTSRTIRAWQVERGR